eukprot:8209271-Pyramimonas_sp.AAC.1
MGLSAKYSVSPRPHDAFTVASPPTGSAQTAAYIVILGSFRHDACNHQYHTQLPNLSKPCRPTLTPPPFSAPSREARSPRWGRPGLLPRNWS